MRRSRAAGWMAVGGLLLGLGAGGCALPASDTPERMGRGPRAEEMFYGRVYAVSGREPTFDERRQQVDRMDDRVFRYLREHPEIEQKTYYSEFRFWRQVSEGCTPDEVRVLIEEPLEQTIDPARMGVLAKQEWGDVRTKAKEAWVYPLGWILYFDDKGVVAVLRRPQSGFLVSE
jgi:hypothetical protein